MKTISKLVIPLLLNLVNVSAQNEHAEEINDAAHPCISVQQYELIVNHCNQNAKQYIAPNTSTRFASGVSLNWPLKAANGFTDCSYYYISAHVDHDNATTTFKDYNCGSITYDGHKGTDIAIGPFPFYKMDNNMVEVIAAAAGTIVDKHDGEFDRNCVGAGSTLVANYVVIQHTDGSRALYWHMKKGKVTSKAIGQTVTQGEYLGIVGSSGSSSGPHLHFEVWAGSTNTTLVDPFSGACNALNTTSWWAFQKPYTEPSVLKASVHTTDYIPPACGTTETSNESTTYAIPFQGAGLSPGYAKFYIFMRNVSTGTTVSMNIKNPDASVFATWTSNAFTSNANYWYSGYSKKLPTIAGTYTFEATYNGITCSQKFDITTVSEIVEETNGQNNGMSFYPNPFNTLAKITLNQPIVNGELNIYNKTGEKVKTLQNISGKEINLNRDHLSNGIYFVRISKENNEVEVGKFTIAD